MKVREKAPPMQELIESLRRLSVEKKAPIWKAVAAGLNRPTRRERKANLYKIEKYAKAKETLVVPGTVLGFGEIKKPVTVAALRFSGAARQKIEKAGGTCLSIPELAEKVPNGRKVRIIG
ncbi:MAG: 50S ribosomal protein L18e [Candidatus Aenigmatarchaeota archaeon]